MSAIAQTVYLCTTLDSNGLCAAYQQYDAALLPASDVPVLNQFLSVLGDAIYNPTPETILYVFSWGFGAVLFFWSLGFAIGVAKRVIRKA